MAFAAPGSGTLKAAASLIRPAISIFSTLLSIALVRAILVGCACFNVVIALPISLVGKIGKLGRICNARLRDAVPERRGCLCWADDIRVSAAVRESDRR